ncbi:GNAT family N-acetyltransferase [Pseudalkalibacillus sp. SCS-8]|uniref:GNAT family N-acetyltransferase n=1 Tax=Pseudalkalibacillus nanhaiensis TaxID=3115291 RepID=UPI0032DB6E28
MSTVKEKICELTTEDQWIQAFPIMNQLREDLSLDTYIDLLTDMTNQGYRLIAMYDDGKIVALAGIHMSINFYNHRYVFINDLVTDASNRSRGYGERLLTYIHEWARERGASYVSLESGIKRKDAHRFYEEKMEYDKWCYSFRKKL